MKGGLVNDSRAPGFLLHGEDIIRYLKVKGKNVVGMAPRDKISDYQNMPKNSYLLINLDDSRGPGTHWVMLKRGEKVYTYYDPFGMPPPPQVLENFRPLRYSNEVQQDPDTAYCGVFCIKWTLLN